MNEIVGGGKKLFLCSATYAPIQQKKGSRYNGRADGSSGAPPDAPNSRHVGSVEQPYVYDV